MTTPCLELLTVNNPKIVQFYNKNPSLNFETVNIMFVETLEKIIKTATTNLSESLANQILQEMKQIQSQMQEMYTTTTTMLEINRQLLQNL